LTNKILVDILLSNNIPSPDPNQPGIMADVAMHDITGAHPHMTVHIPQRQISPSGLTTLPSSHSYISAVDQSESLLSSQLVQVSLSPSSNGARNRTHVNPEPPSMKDQRLAIFSPLNLAVGETLSHPYNLDSTQVGIDFVLG
jgi:hypothetical protein